MRVKSLSFIVAALVLVTACKKNNGSTSNGSSNKLKMYIEDLQIAGSDETDSFNVSYDNQNRITGLTSPDLRFVYTYSNNSFTLDLYEFNALSIHEVAYINSASYVDSTFQYDNTSDTTTEGYQYNGAQLVHLITYTYSSSGTMVETRDDYTYDNSGNMVKDAQSDGSGNLLQVSTLTYTSKPLNVTINPTYFAPASKFLPATESVTDGVGNSLGNITFSYVFDGSGRLTKETDTEDNGTVASKTYIYQ